MEHKRFKPSARWPFIVALLLVTIAVWQHQAIRDWLRLQSYNPDASVVQLADDIALTPEARRLFYVNHPAIQDRESFNASCNSRGEHTIVLGCYHPVDRGIFIFHVSDDRLAGVDQVTAAHEVLHAAYDRLGSKERSRVDRLLQDYNDRGVYDERIKTIIAAYRKSEPNDLVNEMHSIFATEIVVLPGELETYYKRYFTDRAKVVGYANAYQAEFTSRQTMVSDYDKRLQSLKQQIDDNTARLESQESQIATLRAQLDEDRSSDNIEAYNAAVPVYNARIDAYNNLIATTKSIISTYNQVVAERNQLALQVAELAHSIDSTFQPLNDR
jgi:hypothetical protein